MALIDSVVSFVGGPIAGGIVDFIEKYWKPVLILLIIAGSYLYVEGLKHEITDLNNKIQTMQTSLTLCEQARTELKAAITTQNTQIDNLQKQGQQLTNQVTQAATQATALGSQFAAAVTKIITGTKPVGCSPSIQYLVDGIKDLKWETAVSTAGGIKQ